MLYDPGLIPERQLFDMVEYHFANAASLFSSIAPRSEENLEQIILKDPEVPIDYRISRGGNMSWVLECHPAFEGCVVRIPIDEGVTVGSKKTQFEVNPNITKFIFPEDTVEAGTVTVNELIKGLWRVFNANSDNVSVDLEVLTPKTLQEQAFDIFWRADAYDGALKHVVDLVDQDRGKFVNYESLDEDDSRRSMFTSGRIATVRSKDKYFGNGFYMVFEVDDLGIPLIDTDILCGIIGGDPEEWTTIDGTSWRLHDISTIIQGTDAIGLFPDGNVENFDPDSLQKLTTMLAYAEPYPVSLEDFEE